MVSTKTSELCHAALFVVLIAVCAWISIPMPQPMVPFTLQTFAVCITLAVLGGSLGTMAISAYLLLGLAGLPVFAGFKGGPGVLLGATGGYILGFFFSALAYWGITRLFGQKTAVKVAALLAGLAVCYAFGTVWYMTVYAATTGPIGLGLALSWCVLPFLVPDLVKLGLAAALSESLKRYRGGF